MAVAIADKAHTLGTATDLIDGGAASGLGATTLASGAALSITGLTTYDTISVKTLTTAAPTVRITATGELQYTANGSGTPTWTTIGSWDGGDGRALTVTFLDTNMTINAAVVDLLLQSLTVSANIAGTTVQPRTLTFSLTAADGTTSLGTDTSAYTIVGTGNDDTIIYKAGVTTFNPLLGDDTLLVKLADIPATLDMKTAGTYEKFEILNASEANTSINLTVGNTVKDVNLGSASDIINIAAAGDLNGITGLTTFTLDGGAGRDILNATGAVTLGTGDLAKLSSVEIIQLSNNNNTVILGTGDSVDTINGGSDVNMVDTIDASGRTVNTAVSGAYDLYINAGAGADIVKMSDGNDNIDLGADNDTLTVTSAKLDADDKIVGGDGTDKLILNDTTIGDAAFTNVSTVETLEGVATTTTVTLGDKAKLAGINKVDLATTAATGAATVDLSSMTSDGAFTVLAGSAGTTVKMTAANIAAGNDTITGHATATADFDTLEMTTAGTATIAATVTKIETLKLSSVAGDSSVTLNASNDFTKINATAATGNVTIDTTAETTAIAINTGSGNDTLTLGTGVSTVNTGAGNDTVSEKALSADNNSITTGDGDDIVNLVGGNDAVDLGASGALADSADTVKVAYGSFTSADTITGTGTVVLEFTDAVANATATVESKFAATGNAIDTIKLDAATAQTVTLGAYVHDATVTKIDGSAVTAGLTVVATEDTSIANGRVAGDKIADYSKDMTILGGSGADMVQMFSADLTSADSLQMGDGVDILQIMNAATIIDTDFTLSTSLDTVKVGDFTNSVELGNAAHTAGVITVDALAATSVGSAQTVNVTMTNDIDLTVKTGAGADLVKMKGSQLTSGDAIELGSGVDTLEFTDIVNLTDGAFTNVLQTEKIKLSAGDGQKVVLSTQAQQAGILEVDAASAGSVEIDAAGMSILPLKVTTAAGNDIVSLGSGVATVATGAGNDTVKIATVELTSADSIDGGLDTDTLVITNAAALSDGSFTKVSNFESVKLSDAGSNQTVVLGTSAQAKGISTIDGSALAGETLTVTLDAGYSTAAAKVVGGNSADTLKLQNSMLSDSLEFIGGIGTDVIELTDAAAINDAFAKFQEVETLKLADSNLAQTITLGADAAAAGIKTVDGSALIANGSITVDVSAMTTNMTIDTAGTRSGGNDLITAGKGNDAISTGAGDDVIYINSEYLSSGDVINAGGQTTQDILEIASSTAAVADGVFANVTGIELLRLKNLTTEFTVELGTNATAKAITNVLVLGSGGAKIDISALAAAAIINGGSGVETITLGTQYNAGADEQKATLNLNDGNDIVKTAATGLESTDVIDGGTGTNTLQITNATTGDLTDADFTGVRNFQTLQLMANGTQDVTLGELALNAGIRTVDGSAITTSTNALGVDMSGMVTNVVMSITGGYGNDTFTMKAAHLDGDTINGNLGTDSIVLSGVANLVDTAFANISNIDSIAFGVGTGQTVVMGTEAKQGGLTTINTASVGVGNTMSLDVSEMTSTSLNITGGAGNETIKIASADLTNADTIAAGTGTDILELTTASELIADDMLNLSGFETLKLANVAGTQSVILGAGKFTTVDGSAITGSDAITVDASAATNITITTKGGADVITGGTGVNTIDAGSGNNTVKIAGGTLTSADTLTAGAGTSDILEVTGTDLTVADADVGGVTGFETLKVTGSGTKSITVGTTAKARGIVEVDASGATGATTIAAGAYAGAITLKGGSGVDTITAGLAGNTVQAGNGDDTITIDAATLDLNDSIDGGSGNDTLILTGVANLQDANFTNVTGVEKIVLANETGQTVVLGTQAKDGTTGIRTIDTSAVATGKTVTIDVSGMTDTSLNFTGGAGNETIKIASADLTNADTIAAGDGTDILELTTAAVQSMGMTNLSGFETLKLANVTGTQSVTLAAGKFTTVDGSAITGSDALTVNAAATTDITITTKGGADVITAGTGLNTIDSGAGNDTIHIAFGALQDADVIHAGGGTDTLSITGTVVMTDALFNTALKKTDLETIKLASDVAGQSVELGSGASAAGVNKVDTTTVNSAVTVDVSGVSGAMTINTGSGNDTITMGQGINSVDAGAGDDTISVSGSYLNEADAISGGSAGTDTLVITGTAQISDSVLLGVTNIDTLKLSDSASDQSVTLGTNAATNSILSVDTQSTEATHNVTIDMSSAALDAKAMSVTGGAGNETVKMKSTALTSADTINLGIGNDTLQFTDAVNLTNTANENGLSNIETILLSDNNNTLTLKDGIGASLTINATAAKGANKATIDASALGSVTTAFAVNTGEGDDTVTLGSSANTINTSSGNDKIYISNTNINDANADTIDGDVGTADELYITGAANISDAKFANISNVEILKLANENNQSVEIGDQAINGGSGIKEVVAALTGTNKVTVDLSQASSDANTKVTTGTGADTIKIKSADLSTADYIDAGETATDDNSVVDTLELTTAATGADAISADDMAHLSNFEKLQLANVGGAQSVVLADGKFAEVSATGASVGNVTVDGALQTTALKVTTAGGADVITAGTGANDISTGAGIDTITMTNAAVVGATAIDGGTESDTLILSDVASLIATDMNIISNMDKLQLANVGGAQSVVLADGKFAEVSATGASVGNVTVDGALQTTALKVTTAGGADVITAGTGANDISTGAGIDTITMTNAAVVGATAIDGGTESDTLILSDVASLIATDMNIISNMDKLQLANVGGAQSVVLADGKFAEVSATGASVGNVTVDGALQTTALKVTTAGGADVITAGTGANDISTGAGDDQVTMTTSTLTSADKLDLGAGSNTLRLAGTGTLIDTDFNASNAGITKVVYTQNVTESITVGSTMIGAGLNEIDATALTTVAATVDISGISAAFTVRAGSGADTIRAGSGGNIIYAGSGNDTIEISAENLTNASADTIDGQGGTLDVLKITSAINSTNSAIFNSVSNVEKFLLTAGANQKMTLSAYASALIIDASQTSGMTLDAALMTNNLTLNTNTGDFVDTVSLGSGNDTINTYVGDDTIKTLAARLTSADTINFGDGTADVLELIDTNAATMGDTAFATVRGLEKLLLSGVVNTITLGDNARLASVNEVDGSLSGSMDLTLTMTSDIVGFKATGGAGDDTVAMSAAQLTSADIINGGAGNNTLFLKGASTLRDGALTNVTNIKTLKLDNAAQDITLGTEAIQAGMTTIDTSLVGTNNVRLDVSAMSLNMSLTTQGGSDTVVMGQGNDTVDTKAGNDTIRVRGDKFTAGDTINGGDGTDSLEFTSAFNSIDETIFGGVSNIETIKFADAAAQSIKLKGGLASTVDASVLSGTNAITVDASLMSSNMTINSGSGNDTIIAGTTSGTTTTYAIDAGAGNDVIKFGVAGEITNTPAVIGTPGTPAIIDTIKGGAGTDTLEFTTATAQSITDTFFGTHITGVETIKFANVTGNSITLTDATKAAKAAASGLNAVDTSNVATGSAATVNISGYTTAFKVTGGAGNETVTAGTGEDTYTLGAGDDVLNIKTAGWSSADVIAMGDGTDTLNLTDAGIVTDDLFANVTGLDKLVLQDATKDKTVTLGINAKGSGVTEIDGSAASAKKVTIDASIMTNNMTLKGGAGDDTITLGQGNDTVTAGDGNDTIKVANAYFNASDSIDGGVGSADILHFLNTANVSDTSFGQVVGVEGIKLSDYNNQTVTLGDTAFGKEISIVDASSLATYNSATVDFSTVSDANNAAVTVTGGNGDDTVKMKAAHFTSADTLKMGTGSDTLVLTTAASGADAITDSDFGNGVATALKVTGLEVLKLSNFDNQSVTIAANAKAAGLTTIDATALADANFVTVNAASMITAMTIMTGSGNDIVTAGTGVDTIMAGAGDDTITFTSTGYAGDNVDGGSGTADTIAISNAATLLDTAFANTSNVEVLKFANVAGSKATLGSAASAAGIALIDATALTLTNAVTVDADAMSANVTIKTGSGTGADTITLGSGISTVYTYDGADTILTKAANLTSADTIEGGLGADKLVLTTASALTDAVVDADFENVWGIETLQLGSFAAQTVTVGTKAGNKGLTTIDASSSTFGVNVDVSAAKSGMTIKGGSVSDTISLGSSTDTVIAGAGDDFIKVNSLNFTSGDSIDGGLGNDTIQIMDAAETTATTATIEDDDFVNVKGIETLKLGNFANQTVVVGEKASLATVGLRTIDAASNTNAITVNASAATAALTINTGSGNDTISASKGANIINAGAGDDTIKIASVGFDANDKIDGGTSTVLGDTLLITNAANLLDTAWTNITNVEKIKLSNFDSQSIVLGLNAQNKNITMIDAADLTGVNAVSIDTSAMTLDKNLDITTGTGNDTVIIKKGLITAKLLTTADKIDAADASNDNDTLVFADTVGTITDEMFNAGVVVNNTNIFKQIIGFETIALGNFAGQSITLESNAQAKGITTVDLTKITTGTTTVTSNMSTDLKVTGGAGIDIVTVTTDTDDNLSTGAGNDIIAIGGGTDTVNAGIGDDTIKVTDANLTAGDAINGLDGKDTLLILGTAAIADDQLSGVSFVEVLKLSDGGNSSAVLSDNALKAGITTVDASLLSAGNTATVNVSNYSGNITFIGGAGNDTITAGIGNDTFDGKGGSDTYSYASNNLNLGDKIIDTGTGLSDVDTLNITTFVSINDNMFTNIKGVERLIVTDTSSTGTIIVGAKAAAAGLKTIDVRGTNVTVDSSAFTGSLLVFKDEAGGTYKGGTGNDTFLLSDTSFDSSTVKGASTILGNTGTDTIEITTAATIIDNDFGGTANVEVLKLDAGGTATLGTKAQNMAGIRTIDLSASTADSTVDTSAMTTSAMTVKLGTKVDNVTTGAMADTVNVAIEDLGVATVVNGHVTAIANADSIDLGQGVDTLVLTNSGREIVDAQFANISNVEVLKFAKGNNTVILGTEALSTFKTLDATASVAADISTYDISAMNDADTAKIITFNGGLGSETITMGSQNHVIVAGGGNDTIKVTDGDLNSADKVDGGIGTDILQITDAATLIDNDFTLIKGVERIKLDAGGTVTLGAKVQAATISTIDLTTSGNGTTIDTDGYTDGGAKPGMTTSLVVMLGNNTDSVTTGSGNDTVIVDAAHLDNNDTIDLGSGTADILQVNGSAAVTDSMFANVAASVETLKIAGTNAAVTLGTNAKFKTLEAATATQAMTVSVAAMTSAITMNLGAGNDNVTMGTVAHTVNTNNGNDTITLGATGTVIETAKAGAGDDVINTTMANLNASDIMDGGANSTTGKDVLTITTSASITDALLTKKTGIETLKLDAGGSAILGANAVTMGLTTVELTAGGSVTATAVTKGLILNGGAGDDTITGTGLKDTITIGAGTDVINAGLGDDVILVTDAGFGSDTINGGGGIDVLQFVDASTNANSIDGDFTNVSSVEKIVFSNVAGAQEFNYGDTARTKLVKTLDASALKTGNSITFDMSGLSSAASTILIGGAGDDTFKFNNVDLTNLDTITGGLGIDKIVMSDAATISESKFGTITGIEEIILSDAASQSVTLGVKAQTAGIKTVNGSALNGTNAVTIDVGAYTADLVMTLKGGQGDDTFKMKAAHFAKTDVIEGGSGTDTLQFTDAAIVTDDDFTNVSGVETLKLGNFTAQTVTLGAIASSKGVVSVNASAVTTNTNTVKIDAGAMAAATLNLVGGLGIDTFRIKGTDLTSADTITGNTSGTGKDTLILTGGAILADAAWTLVSGVENVVLEKGADYTLEMNTATPTTKAQDAGIVSVDGSALLAGDVLSVDALNYTVALSVKGGADADTIKTGTGNDTITAGAGNDTIESGSGNDTINAGTGDDTITFAVANLTKDDGVVGDLGIDTIKITGDGITVSDSNDLNSIFSKVTGVEKLTLLGTGAQSVTLNEKAKLAGIVSVDVLAGTSSTITNNMTSNVAMTIVGSAGVDTISFKNATFDSVDSIDGNGGNDVLIISDAATVIDADFTKVVEVETLKLGANATAQTVTLGNLAKTAGITKVDASAITTAVNTALIDISSMTADISGFTVLGGGATTLKLKNGHLTSADTFTGSTTGVDTLWIADAASVVDSMFNTNFSELDGIKLSASTTAGQSVVLGSNAMTAGLKKVDASAVANGVSIDVRATDVADTLTLIGGVAADTFIFSNAALTSADTITAGTGTDILEITDTAVTADTDFTLVTGLEKIVLDANATQSIELGAKAKAAGVVNIDASAIGSANTFTLDMSTAIGTAADSVMTVMGGSGNDTIKMINAHFLGTDIIDGNDGVDVIMITDVANLTDANFANKKNIETLDLAGTASKVVLGAYAANSGLNKVDAADTSGVIVDARAMTPQDGLTVLGGAGNDKFYSSKGADTLSGGAGNDIFVYSNAALANGDDRITDFTADGTDKIGITIAGKTAGTAMSAGDYALYVLSVDQAGSDTMISLTGGDSITLTGVTATNITVADFIYG